MLSGPQCVAKVVAIEVSGAYQKPRKSLQIRISEKVREWLNRAVLKIDLRRDHTLNWQIREVTSLQCKVKCPRNMELRGHIHLR